MTATTQTNATPAQAASALKSLTERLETHASGELTLMFASYNVASRMPRQARNDLVDSAVNKVFAGDEAKRIQNIQNRTRVFFSASRHFTIDPHTIPAGINAVSGWIFTSGNQTKISEVALKQALDGARKAALALVPGAVVTDLKGNSGERYAWAAALDKADGPNGRDTAFHLLTHGGIAEFFAARLKPTTDARLAAEAEALAKVKAQAEADAQAALLLANREAESKAVQAAETQAAETPPAADAPAANAPAADAPAADAPAADAPAADAPAADAPAADAPAADAPAADAPAADAPAATGENVLAHAQDLADQINNKRNGTSPKSPPAGVTGSPSMSARSDDQAEILHDLPKAPEEAKRRLARMMLHCLTLGIDQQAQRTMLAAAAKAYAQGNRDAANKAPQAAVASGILSQ